MQDVIARLRAGKKDDEGFTLIELLVVVVIIGVLVAIAVPVYLNYREGAADKSAQSDVRGAISAIEQYYTNAGNSYPATKNEPNTTGTVAKLELGTATNPATVTLSDNTKLGYVYDSTAKTYKICASNTGGSGKWYLYDSAAGGSVKASASVLVLATCVPA
jgi:type IV pilus assembly protein PilA